MYQFIGYFAVRSVKELFEGVDSHTAIDFVKEALLCNQL